MYVGYGIVRYDAPTIGSLTKIIEILAVTYMNKDWKRVDEILLS